MRQTYDKEKVSLNLARLKTHGYTFEVVIDPDNAVKFRHDNADIRETIKAEHIYKDAVKGELASEHHMQEVFTTTDALKIAARIIKEGSIQVSDDYRDNLRREKLGVVTSLLLKNGADSNTGAPLTATRINNAFREAKLHVDIFKKVEDQIDELVEKLRPVLPITFEKKLVNVRIPANNAAKLYGFVNSNTKIIDQAWLSDGAWSCKAELAAGMVTGFIDELKSKTHGDVEVSIENKPVQKKK